MLYLYVKRVEHTYFLIKRIAKTKVSTKRRQTHMEIVAKQKKIIWMRIENHKAIGNQCISQPNNAKKILMIIVLELRIWTDKKRRVK